MHGQPQDCGLVYFRGDVAGSFQAIHHRHLQVQDYDIRLQFLRLLYSDLAIFGFVVDHILGFRMLALSSTMRIVRAMGAPGFWRVAGCGSLGRSGRRQGSPHAWRQLYRAALLEVNHTKLVQRITDAHLAIVNRIETTLAMPESTEQHELYDALKGLRVLCEEYEESARQRLRQDLESGMRRSPEHQVS